MQAGAAKVDITPEKDIQIGGDIGRRRPVQTIVDPLYARALVVSAGPRKLCVVSLDLISISDAYAKRVRDEAAARFGFEPDAVLVHVIQTHAAPGLGRDVPAEGLPDFAEDLWWLFENDPRYQEPTFPKIMHAIELAHAALQPARLTLGRRTDGRVAFNRRFVLRDGTAKCHPPRCSPDILHCEGPIDPEVAIAVFRSHDDKAIAAILHHTCHPCHFYPLTKISAGWPGAWCNRVRDLLGPPCEPLVLNGFCGNVHHTNHLDPDHVDDHLAMAATLTDTTQKILQSPMHTVQDTAISFEAKSLRIPLRPMPPETLTAAKKLLAQHPEPLWLDDAKTRVDWSWCYAADRLALARLHEKQTHFDYRLQALRLGDLAMVGGGGEPFVEAQLKIKLASPAPFTIAAHGCGMDAAYVPTAQALERGGYETDLSTGSKLAPQALDMIADAAIDLLGRLYR